jgi:hypothetical protein
MTTVASSRCLGSTAMRSQVCDVRPRVAAYTR